MTSNLTCRISIKSGFPNKFTIFPNHRDDDDHVQPGQGENSWRFQEGNSNRKLPRGAFGWMDGFSLMAGRQLS